MMRRGAGEAHMLFLCRHPRPGSGPLWGCDACNGCRVARSRRRGCGMRVARRLVDTHRYNLQVRRTKSFHRLLDTSTCLADVGAAREGSNMHTKRCRREMLFHGQVRNARTRAHAHAAPADPLDARIIASDSRMLPHPPLASCRAQAHGCARDAGTGAEGALW